MKKHYQVTLNFKNKARKKVVVNVLDCINNEVPAELIGIDSEQQEITYKRLIDMIRCKNLFDLEIKRCTDYRRIRIYRTDQFGGTQSFKLNSTNHVFGLWTFTNCIKIEIPRNSTFQLTIRFALN